jgi:hypothetical protein
MGSTLQLIRQEYKECLVCAKTLGHDTRESGLMFCHEHNACSSCKEPVNLREALWCLERYHKLLEPGQEPAYIDMDIIHIRCAGLAQTIKIEREVPVSSLELDYLNMIRLSVIPDMELSLITNENNARLQSTRLVSEMDFEQKSLHLKMLEACVAQTQIAIQQDPKRRKDALAEREKRHFDKARKEALTSSRPTTKAVDDSEEIALGQFMSDHGLLERKAALKIFKQRNNSIDMLTKFGGSKEAIAIAIDADLLKTGVYKK